MQSKSTADLLREVRKTLRTMKQDRSEIDREIRKLERVAEQLGESKPAPRRKRAEPLGSIDAARGIVRREIGKKGSMTLAEASSRWGATGARALIGLAGEEGSGISPDGKAKWKRGLSPNFVYDKREAKVRVGIGVERGRVRA